MYKTIVIIFLTFNYSQLHSQITKEWVAVYNGPGGFYDEGNSIAVDSTGNVYVAGQTSIGVSDYRFTVLKYFGNGNFGWVRTLGSGNPSSKALEIKIDNNGYIYSTGPVQESGRFKMLLVKFNSDGGLMWSRTYEVDNQDESYKLVIDQNNNIYVVGYGYSNGNTSLVTLKYDQNGNQQWVSRYPIVNGYNEFIELMYRIPGMYLYVEQGVHTPEF
jgi:hypothetical protein